MNFRCVALIALWTLVSGPILGGGTLPSASTAPSTNKVPAKVYKAKTGKPISAARR